MGVIVGGVCMISERLGRGKVGSPLLVSPFLKFHLCWIDPVLTFRFLLNHHLVHSTSSNMILLPSLDDGTNALPHSLAAGPGNPLSESSHCSQPHLTAPNLISLLPTLISLAGTSLPRRGFRTFGISSLQSTAHTLGDAR